MMLIEETTVPQTALPMAQFRAHLRLGTGFADDGVQDAVLESFLRAAIASIEARTGKILLSRRFTWTLTGWRDGSGQALPVAPVTAIDEVRLIDRTGTETVLDPLLYRLERDGQLPRLRPLGGYLPNIPGGGAVEITFEAGFGTDWASLPQDLAQAVMLLAAHYYEFRNETGLGEGCMPFGVTSLIERYKPMRLGAGRLA